MAIALDRVQVEQRVGDLIVDDVVVGPVFSAQFVNVDGSVEASTKAGVEGALALNSVAAQVVKQFIQLHSLVLMKASGGGPCRRQRHRLVHELLFELCEGLSLRRLATCAKKYGGNCGGKELKEREAHSLD